MRPGLAEPQAQANSGITLVARAGFDGYYKDGFWLPIRVTVENNGADVSGTLAIANPQGYTNNTTIFTRQLDLPTQSKREFFLHIAPEAPASSVKVALNSDGKELKAVSARVTSLAAGSLLFGILANTPSAYNAIVQVTPATGSSYLAQLEAVDLPAQSFAWQALDVLVISDVDTGALSSEQRAALANWVTSGGQLVVMGGPGWQKTAAGIREVLPLVPTGTQTLNDLSALATYAGSTDPISGATVVATGELAPGASALLKANSVPLIATKRFGFGQVIFFAVDPAFAPLKNWNGLPDLFRRVLSVPLDRPSWALGMSNWSQVQTAVGALPNLQLPNPLLICGFLGFYLLIVGPVNYFALRFIKRRELAWFTIPVIVLGFSVTAYITGFFFIGGQAVLHQLSIVQVWPDANEARVDQAVGVFSPNRTTYTLEFARGFLARQIPNIGGAIPSTINVEQGEASQLSGIRTDIASIQGFVSQGFVSAPKFESNLRVEVNGGSAQLIGEIVNRSALTLKDAVLLAPGGVLRLGDFAPNQTQQISMPLTSGRATPAPSNTIVPVAGGIVSNPYAAPYYPSVYDSTIDDIIGNTQYYNDRESYRRYTLLSAAINTYTGNATIGRGSGFYLAGWVTGTPAPARLTNAGFRSDDLSVYLIGLRADFDFGSGTITVSPGLMTWTPLSYGQSGSSASPYDTTLYTGDTFGLRFNSVQPLRYSRVQDLTLNLYGSSYGVSGNTNVTPLVALWDFETDEWVELDVPAYGTHTVSEPERFVGPDGEIRARLSSPGADSISLSTLDFNLTVEP